MKHDYWHQRWKEGRTGWHLAEANPDLVKWWPSLKLTGDETVLVPLCGKSKDLLWLKEQGHQVFGNELSEKALAEFREECGEAANGIEFHCGDIFELHADALQGATAWYDRAALVAMPSATRKKYFIHLSRILPVGAKGLLITFRCDKDKEDGPPFLVDEADVYALCEGLFHCTVLEQGEEPTYLLEKRPEYYS